MIIGNSYKAQLYFELDDREGSGYSLIALRRPNVNEQDWANKMLSDASLLHADMYEWYGKGTKAAASRLEKSAAQLIADAVFAVFLCDEWRVMKLSRLFENAVNDIEECAEYTCGFADELEGETE